MASSASSDSPAALPALDPAVLAKAQALFALGAQLHADKRLDGSQALATFEQARQLAPSSPEILNALGAVLSRMGRHEEAMGYFAQALQHQPLHADALENLAGLLHRTQRYEQAAEHLQRWLQAAAGQAQLAPYVMGRLAYTRRLMADWRDDDAQIRALQQALNAGQTAAFPFEFLGFSDDPAEHLTSARTLVADRHPAKPQALWQGQRWTNTRIKVAYVSNDFCNHATAVLLAQVLALHDKNRFEIFALSWSPLQDAMHQRIRNAVEHFIDISKLSDEQVAQWLHAQQIDICMDIKGFASHYRLGIFAHRPCPLQVSYLGYPGSSGAPYMDYLIADAHVIAIEDSVHYSEHLVRLPHSYQANDPTREVAPPPTSRQALGLPERGNGTQGFVFACFNNSYKITPELFAQWMQVLQATPGSVLWLLEANDWVKNNLRQQASAQGVDPARLLFAPRVPTPEHLARHAGADLFLDTFPVNAHTTAADALWMGLPVLSRYGRSFSSRVAYSLLHGCQVPGGAPLVQELAVEQSDGYVQRAIDLARDPARLQRLKDHLHMQRARLPLFDAELTCHHLQAAYSAMWQRWQAGLAPAAMDIAASEPTRSAPVPSQAQAQTQPVTTDLAQATASQLQTLSLGLLTSGPPQLALAVFDAALKARPQESALWRARAHTALRLPEAALRAQGLADLQRAHQLDPTHERLRFELALTLEQSGDVAAACQHLAHLETQAPQDSQYPLKHVRCLRSMGQLEAALAVCQQWVQRQPSEAQAWTQQASAHWALLPALLARFSKAHPQLVATLHDSNAAQMVAQVLSREADLALGSDIGQTHSELATERLFSERMALFLRHDHPLAHRASVQGRDLDGLPLVHVNPDAVVWRAISRELSTVANVYPQVVHHVSMLTTAFGMIQAGAGVALLPRYVARLMPPDLRAVPIVRPVLEFPVVAIRLAKQPLSPAAMAFLAMARQHLKPSVATT
eukprot:gene28209-35026_t